VNALTGFSIGNWPPPFVSTVRTAGFEAFRESDACSLEFRHEGKGIHCIGQKVKTGLNVPAFGNHASSRCHDEAVDPVIALFVVKDLSVDQTKASNASILVTT
jgi:hypothetical protein